MHLKVGRCLKLCLEYSLRFVYQRLEIMLFDFAGFQLVAELLTCIFLFFFLQEINHAGAGGLWAELVSNRGHFEIGCFYSSAAKDMLM